MKFWESRGTQAIKVLGKTHVSLPHQDAYAQLGCFTRQQMYEDRYGAQIQPHIMLHIQLQGSLWVFESKRGRMRQ